VSFYLEHLELSNINLAQGCDIISVFTVSQLKKEVLDKLADLKLIAIRATGFDNIDVEEAEKRKIVACNVPTYGENTVAEHTFGLILNLSRKIYQSIQSVREKGFIPDGLRGFDLKEKTLGIIGTGHIGSHVARIAKGFEMNILAYDVNRDKKLTKNLGIKYVSLEDLLKNSDIITLHVPYNKHTHHLISLGNINLIKRGTYLINTSRGGVVETSALVKALHDGILAGAGLDVMEGEHELGEERELLAKAITEKIDFKTMLQNHILMEHDNVIITPHNAFNSKEALERILQTTVENIKAFIAKKPINIVS